MDGDAGGVINRDQLRNYVERVAHLHDDRDTLNGDIREVYREAKDAGFDTTILREIVREHRTDAEPRHSRYRLLDAYRNSLGLSGTPLGDYAERQEATVHEMPKRGRGRPRKERPMDFEFDGDLAGNA